MFSRLLPVYIFLLILPAALYAGVGESAVPTLTLPYGPRSIAMGEVGTALADDASALFFNPAGLGFYNKAWQRGALSYSYETLLPAFKMEDMWHSSFSATYQISKEIGGFAFSRYRTSTGNNNFTDAMGREGHAVRSYETVLSLGYGKVFPSTAYCTHSLGVTLKLFNSATLTDEFADLTSFAVDIGYIGKFRNGLRFGINLANMGPSVYYVDNKNRNPIPFTFNAAVAYTRGFDIKNVESIRINAELRIDKELVINHFDGIPEPFYKALFVDPFNEPVGHEFQEINYHLGCEGIFYNTIALREGFLIDQLGYRYENHFGFGLFLCNHFRFDYSYIFAPEGFMKSFYHFITGNRHSYGATGARDGQWQIAFSIDALGNWTKEDLQWWKVSSDKRRDW